MAYNRLVARGAMSVRNKSHNVFGDFVRVRTFSVEPELMIALGTAVGTIVVTVGSGAYFTARKLSELEGHIEMAKATITGDFNTKILGGFGKLSADLGKLDTKLAGDLGKLDTKLAGDLKLMSGDLGKLDTKLAGDISLLGTKVDETVKRVESNTRAFAEAEAHKVINMFAKKV